MLFPQRFFHLLFSLLMSLVMATLMTALVTLINTGWQHGYLGRLARAWIIAWPISFGIVLISAPLVRKLAARLVQADTR